MRDEEGLGSDFEKIPRWTESSFPSPFLVLSIKLVRNYIFLRMRLKGKEKKTRSYQEDSPRTPFSWFFQPSVLSITQDSVRTNHPYHFRAYRTHNFVVSDLGFCNANTVELRDRTRPTRVCDYITDGPSRLSGLDHANLNDFLSILLSRPKLGQKGES